MMNSFKWFNVDWIAGRAPGVQELIGPDTTHSAGLHVLQASTLTNDGMVKGCCRRLVGRARQARPGTENSPKFTRPVAPPSSPFNL